MRQRKLSSRLRIMPSKHVSRFQRECVRRSALEPKVGAGVGGLKGTNGRSACWKDGVGGRRLGMEEGIGGCGGGVRGCGGVTAGRHGPPGAACAGGTVPLPAHSTCTPEHSRPLPGPQHTSTSRSLCSATCGPHPVHATCPPSPSAPYRCRSRWRLHPPQGGRGPDGHG